MLSNCGSTGMQSRGDNIATYRNNTLGKLLELSEANLPTL